MKRLSWFIAFMFLTAGLATADETTNYGLGKPARGARGWDVTFNNNMDLIDAAIGDISSEIADSPEVYFETGTFNYTTGDTITLPKSVSAVTEYGVAVVPTSRAGAIGDIYVTRTTSNFVVKCSENNTTDTFLAIIYYEGDLNAYGASVYREWIVSTDASITDHGDSSDTGSLAWVMSQAGANEVNIRMPGNHTYALQQDVTVPATATLKPDRGAMLDLNMSIRSGTYRWTLSGSGTNEYYLELAAGGNPNIDEPNTTIESNADMTDGAAGSLATGEWDWNDNDALGWSTVYARLSDSTDPDGKAAGYVEAEYLITCNGKFSPNGGIGQYFVQDAYDSLVFAAGSARVAHPEWWGANPNGSDECGKAINIAAHCGLKTVGFVGFGTYQTTEAIVLPAPPAGAVGDLADWTADRVDITLTGIDGIARIRSGSAINLIESYSVTSDPATLDWTAGVIIRDLYLDGQDAATNGIALLKCAAPVTISNVTAVHFTSAGFKITKCLEVEMANCVGARNDYGINAADGTTFSIQGGRYNNNSESGLHFRWPTEYAGMNGYHAVYGENVVAEGNTNYGLHIEAGERFLFEHCHFENNDTHIKVEDSSSLVDEPRGLTFMGCVFADLTTYGFDLGASCLRIRFLECRGPTQAATFSNTSAAVDVYIRNGTFQNDMLPWSVQRTAGSIVYEFTEAGDTTWYAEAEAYGQSPTGYTDEYVQIADGNAINIAFDSGDAADMQINLYSSTGGTVDANPILALGQSGGEPFIYGGAGGASAVDVRLTRASADLWQTGSNDRFWARAGLLTMETTANVSNPPTNAQLDTVFGTEATVGDGFMGVVDDSDTANYYLCVVSNGTWIYFTLDGVAP